MVVKQRAVAVADKEERRHAILDAAESLFLEHPERMASVAEVAAAAGLAKGTVYLYFPSKEEMLLALHERHTQAFFDRFVARVAGPGPAGFDEILAVARRHFIQRPGCLALTSRCFGIMERDLPVEAAIAFKVRVGSRLAAAGAALEKRFPTLPPGSGARLLQHSLAVIVGLWQIIHPVERFGRAFERSELAMLMRDYDLEIDRALRALWSGTIAPASAKPALRSPKGGRR